MFSQKKQNTKPPLVWVGCLEPILPEAQSGGGTEGLWSGQAGVAVPPPSGWVEVGIRSQERLLSQTPLRQGQSRGGLGPSQPPRTLRLPGARRGTQRPWPSRLSAAPASSPRSLRLLPTAPPSPPQPGCLGCEALEWAPASSPKFPQAHDPQALLANRFPPQPVPALGSGRHLEAALLLPLTTSLLPVSPIGTVLVDQARFPPVGACRTQEYFLRHPASPGSSTDFLPQQRNSILTLLKRIWTQKTPVSRKYNHLSKSVIYMHFNSLGIESQPRVPQHGVKYNQSLRVILYIL